MPGWLVWALLVAGAALISGLVYWQLVLAEGAYLGQGVVTYLYDITARRYDQIKQYDAATESAFLGEPLSALLTGIADPLVLDVGTGTGRLPLTLLEQPGFRGRVIGVDASRPMLEGAAQRLDGYEHRTLLIWRDGAQLPFADATFDCVTCLEMLEFTPRPEAQIAEALRVLRPGGILLTTRRRGWNAAIMPGKTHSVQAFRAMLEQHGIARVEILVWQVEYDLVWGLKAGELPSRCQHVLDALRCPACRQNHWLEDDDGLHCQTCGAVYATRGGIVDMLR
jgi:ubiquinone/menaquinone biosynthesis C-methylase UbiE